MHADAVRASRVIRARVTILHPDSFRDHRYLNWRYCERPDATYFLYGFERGRELEGLMVARSNHYEGMPWGYLVDFLVPEGANEVLAALIDEAVDELRRRSGDLLCDRRGRAFDIVAPRFLSRTTARAHTLLAIFCNGRLILPTSCRSTHGT